MIQKLNYNIQYYKKAPRHCERPTGASQSQYSYDNAITTSHCFNAPRNDQSIQLPSGNQNYVIVDQTKVDCFLKQREHALPYIADVLGHSNNEAQITEMLYIFNSMIDEGVKDTKKMYPVLARFNNTTSPNIQTFLAGIYRKLQVPDAFGPLVKMLIQNSLKPQTSNFDPNEEIGGAILAYLNPRFRNKL